MKKYDDGYLLWIADLEVQRTLKQREIEQDKVYLKIDSGLSNHDIGRIFLDSLLLPQRYTSRQACLISGGI